MQLRRADVRTVLTVWRAGFALGVEYTESCLSAVWCCVVDLTDVSHAASAVLLPIMKAAQKMAATPRIEKTEDLNDFILFRSPDLFTE